MASENGKVMNYACPICGKEMLVLPGSYDYEYICADDDCPASEHYMTTPYTEALSVVLTGKDADLAAERARLSARIAELEKECATPVLVATNRLADALADERVRAEKLAVAAEAYRDLGACYRLGTRPSEKLFARLESANATLAEYRKEGA